jgi:hypothetical protein
MDEAKRCSDTSILFRLTAIKPAGAVDFKKIQSLSKLAVTFVCTLPSSQRKLGSSVFAASTSLDPSFRWDDGQKSMRHLSYRSSFDTAQPAA